jgi:hypothetical protein
VAPPPTRLGASFAEPPKEHIAKPVDAGNLRATERSLPQEREGRTASALLARTHDVSFRLLS